VSLRNTLTNIAGSVIALYGSSEIALGHVTAFEAIVGGATALLSFATGAKDDRLEALLARIVPEEKVVARTAGNLLLETVAGRMGYDLKRRSDESQNQNRGQYDRKVDSEVARNLDGRTGRASKPYQAAVEEARRTQSCWNQRIDGAGITGPEYVARTKAAINSQGSSQTGDFCVLDQV
jgi:hypothetical protein